MVPNNQNIIDGLAEITLPKPDNFLIVKETLTRIGVPTADGRKLIQLCHILHKQGRYFITHFKELFVLDGQPSTFDEQDCLKRNTIIKLLAEWKLVVPKDTNFMEWPGAPLAQIKVVPYHEKSHWELVPKYHLGKRKKVRHD